MLGMRGLAAWGIDDEDIGKGRSLIQELTAANVAQEQAVKNLPTATKALYILKAKAYLAWGNVLVNTAPDFTPFGFAGGMYDNQTKLVRFGARDYDAETGRWAAKDLIGFGGGLWNLYSYCGEQPEGNIDPNGLWLGWGHGDILNSAFSGILNADEIETLKNASDDQDGSYGGAEYCYMHAMRPPWQTIEQAKAIYNKFLCDSLDSAIRNNDLTELGRGMHALMDSTSPSHSGFQAWLGGFGSGNVSNAKAGWSGMTHFLGEMGAAYMYSQEKSLALLKIQDYFNKFKKGCPCK